MRRKDREITEFDRMLAVLEACDCCRLGFWDGEGVYILPLNFGYTADGGKGDGLTLYFHGALEGKKIDLAKDGPRVGFEMDTKHELITHETACGYAYRYQSIIGRGDLKIVTDPEEKILGLERIMAHYSGRDTWEIRPEMAARVAVLRLTVTEWSCKEHE